MDTNKFSVLEKWSELYFYLLRSIYPSHLLVIVSIVASCNVMLFCFSTFVHLSDTLFLCLFLLSLLHFTVSHTRKHMDSTVTGGSELGNSLLAAGAVFNLYDSTHPSCSCLSFSKNIEFLPSQLFQYRSEIPHALETQEWNTLKMFCTYVCVCVCKNCRLIIYLLYLNSVLVQTHAWSPVLTMRVSHCVCYVHTACVACGRR